MYNQSSAEKEAHPKASRASIMTICDCNTAIYLYRIKAKLYHISTQTIFITTKLYHISRQSVILIWVKRCKRGELASYSQNLI